MAAKTGVSLASLDVRTNTDVPFEFEYLDHNRKPTGIFLSVLGGQSATVRAGVNAIILEKRKEAAARTTSAMKRRVGIDDELPITTPQEEYDMACRMSAVALVGWRRPGETDGLKDEQVKRFKGIEEEFSPANALQLIRSNPNVKAQVDVNSDDLDNFTKASPKAS